MRFQISLLLTMALLGGCASIEPTAPRFQVGDVAIAKNFSRYPQFNGTPVRVTGALQHRWVKGGSTLRCYAVTTMDGHELAAQDFQLQIPPKTEQHL